MHCYLGSSQFCSCFCTCCFISVCFSQKGTESGSGYIYSDLGLGFIDSNFSDIFDVDWFISSVAPDVKVIKELPPSSKKFISNQMSSLRVPRKVSPHYYLTRILPILKRKQVWLPSFAVFCYRWFVPHFDTFACSLAFIIMVMAWCFYVRP